MGEMMSAEDKPLNANISSFFDFLLEGCVKQELIGTVNSVMHLNAYDLDQVKRIYKCPQEGEIL